MKLGIIGNGVVGSATAEAFRDHEIRVYDVLRSRRTHSLNEVLASEIVFICLPTPQKVDGLECDTSAIDDLFSTISFEGDFIKTNLVLRSTVPVGYTKRAREILGLTNLVHSPEFLTARTSKEDACNPTRLVIGYPPRDRATACHLYDLYFYRWPNIPIFNITSDESEFIKLFQNSFSAIKIAAFNEGYSFAKKKGLDWQICLEALLAGGWVNRAHTQIPGPDGKFGYGGNCLPKDIANLAQCLLDIDLPPTMCQAAIERNTHDRQKGD